MSWREQITRRLVEAAKARDARTVASGIGYPSGAHSGKYVTYPELVSPHAAQQEINAIGSAEQMFNRAQGNRMLAAEQAQQHLNELRAIPGAPHRVQSLEDTLGVLQSEHPLDQWWNIK